MASSRWMRKRRYRRGKKSEDSHETAGPNRDCRPVAPPPTNPHPREGREHEDSEKVLARRQALIMIGIRYGVALLTVVIWVLLPADLRSVLSSAFPS